MLTEYQLKHYAIKFLKENYSLDLIVPLSLNGRLKTAKGRFIYYAQSRKPKVVELNKTFVQYNEPSVVLDVLRHELVHYALFMKGLPHSDGQPTFEKELKRLGIVSQSTINNYKIVSPLQIYGCKDCDKEYKMTKRLRGNGKNHRCKCGGSLIDKGKRLISA